MQMSACEQQKLKKKRRTKKNEINGQHFAPITINTPATIKRIAYDDISLQSNKWKEAKELNSNDRHECDGNHLKGRKKCQTHT